MHVWVVTTNLKNAYDDLYTDSNTTYVQTNNRKCKAKM